MTATGTPDFEFFHPWRYQAEADLDSIPKLAQALERNRRAMEEFYNAHTHTYTSGSFPEIVVAGSDAPAEIIASAQYTCDGTDDHVEINQALADTRLASGGIVYLIGTFTIKDSLIVQYDGTVIQGQGRYATAINAGLSPSWSYDAMLHFNNKEGCQLLDLSMDMNFYGDGADCIIKTIYGSDTRGDNIRIARCTLSEADYDAIDFGTGSYHTDGAIVEDCRIVDAANWGIKGLGNEPNIRVSNCWIRSNGSATAGGGVYVRGTQFHITDSWFYGNFRDVFIDVSGTARIQGCDFNNMTDASIYGSTSATLYISDCTFDNGSTTQAYIERCTTYASNCSFIDGGYAFLNSNCSVVNCLFQGQSQHVIDAWGWTFVVGSRFRHSAASKDMIYLGSIYSVNQAAIIGNSFESENGTTAVSRYCINIDDTQWEQVAVLGNRFHDDAYVTGILNDGGTGTITDFGVDPNNHSHAPAAPAAHTHVEVDITDLDHAGPIATHAAVVDAHHSRYTDAEADARIAAAVVNALSDVVITTPADNEVLAYDTVSGNWINQTAAEAGLSAPGHTHVEADVTDLAHTTDHGALGGLADDDHAQYILVDGTRAFTGPVTLPAGSAAAVSLHGGTTNSGLYFITGVPTIACLGAQVAYFGNLAAFFSVPVRASSPSVSNVGFQFNGDADTGLHNPSANNLQLVAGGVAYVTVNSSAVTLTVPLTINTSAEGVALVGAATQYPNYAIYREGASTRTAVVGHLIDSNSVYFQADDGSVFINAKSASASAVNVTISADDSGGTARVRAFFDGDGNTVFYGNNGTAYLTISTTDITAATTVTITKTGTALNLKGAASSTTYMSLYREGGATRTGLFGNLDPSSDDLFVASEDGKVVIRATSTGASAQDVYLQADNASGVITNRVLIDGDGDTYLYDSNGSARFRVNTTGLAFYGTAPVAKPTVTGSKGGNAALTSLMTALANLGLVTNSTT